MRRILITRPRHKRAQSLMAELEAIGWQSVYLPLIRCSFLRVRFPSFENYDLVICVSLRAAEALVRQEIKTRLPIVVAGQQTAAYLNSYGFNSVCPDNGVGSEAMLSSPELSNVHDKHILLIAGDKGRQLLERKLSELGAQLDKLVVYACSLCHYSLASWQQLTPLDAIWVTSGRILQALEENILANRLNWLYRIQLLVGSERLLEMAKALPFHQPIGLMNTYNETLVNYLSNNLWQPKR